jgi:hypothetical protein
MKVYGVLPQDHQDTQPIDPYQLDRDYWRSLWYVPRSM